MVVVYKLVGDLRARAGRCRRADRPPNGETQRDLAGEGGAPSVGGGQGRKGVRAMPRVWRVSGWQRWRYGRACEAAAGPRLPQKTGIESLRWRLSHARGPAKSDLEMWNVSLLKKQYVGTRSAPAAPAQSLDKQRCKRCLLRTNAVCCARLGEETLSEDQVCFWRRCCSGGRGQHSAAPRPASRGAGRVPCFARGRVRVRLVRGEGRGVSD